MNCASSLSLASSVHTSLCHRIRHRNFIFGIHTHICASYRCGITRDTRCSRCAIAAVLLSVYGRFRQFCGGCALDVPCPKCIILFADVTSLKGTVTSHVTSQCCTCIGHVTFYYKRSANTSVQGSYLLFICSSGSTLSPETCE